jgi:hypothetical protein
MRSLALIVTPAPPSELRSIFSEQPNSIRRALENPPELRPRGWGIATGATAQFIDGEFVETEGFRKVIELYRDGQLIAVTAIDRESLAWADKSDARIHPLALVEFVTNALIFYRLVLSDMRSPPQALHLELRLNGLIENREGTSLPSGALNNVGWTFGARQASTTACTRAVTIEMSTYEPARAAFLLLRELYVWFGHSDDDIPYTSGTGDDRVIDTAAIANIR